MNGGWEFSSLCFLVMLKYLMLAVGLTALRAEAQKFDVQQVRASADYQMARVAVEKKYKNLQPGRFGESIAGVEQRLATVEKVIALTFDACGGPKGSGVDTVLTNFLKREKIPATFFVAGPWIEKNLPIFKQWCSEPLFELENHGLTHHPCTLGNESKYGIKGTGNVGAAFDEVELNARQIEYYAHRKPEFYRPATAATDEGCVTLAQNLHETIVSFSALPGDAVARAPKERLIQALLKQVKPGGIVLMHVNHPDWNGAEALMEAIPQLRKLGYRFVKLDPKLQANIN